MNLRTISILNRKPSEALNKFHGTIFFISTAEPCAPSQRLFWKSVLVRLNATPSPTTNTSIIYNKILVLSQPMRKRLNCLNSLKNNVFTRNHGDQKQITKLENILRVRGRKRRFKRVFEKSDRVFAGTERKLNTVETVLRHTEDQWVVQTDYRRCRMK